MVNQRYSHVCAAADCGERFCSARALLRHRMSEHKEAWPTLRGTAVAKNAAAEAAKDKKLEVGEFDFVEPGRTEEFVNCKVCHENVKLRDIPQHFAEDSQCEPPPVVNVKKWLCVKDYQHIRVGRPWSCIFNACYQKALPKEEVDETGVAADSQALGDRSGEATPPLPSLEEGRGAADAGEGRGAADAGEGRGAACAEEGRGAADLGEGLGQAMREGLGAPHVQHPALAPRVFMPVDASRGLYTDGYLVYQLCVVCPLSVFGQGGQTHAPHQWYVQAPPAAGAVHVGAPVAQPSFGPSSTFPGAVTISKDAKAWKLPSQKWLDTNDGRRRFTWPTLTRPPVDFSAFEAHIEMMHENAGTRSAAMLGVRYFFELFEYPPGQHSVLEAFKQICRQKLVLDAQRLDILSPVLCWTLNICGALEKLVAWVIVEADDNKDAEASQLATSFKIRFVAFTRKKCLACAKEREDRRFELDKERASKLPPVEVMRAASKQAMFDMAVLHAKYIDEFKAKGCIPASVRSAMNAKVYGIAAFRSFPGRPGEWERMRRDVVQEACKDPSVYYITVRKHKSSKSSGVLGRLLPTDFKWAAEKLMDFGDEEKNKLFQPCGEKSKTVELSKVAAQFARAHTPGYEKPEPTLMRKFAETSVGEEKHKAKAKEFVKAQGLSSYSEQALTAMAKNSAHKYSTQGRYYNFNAKDPKKMADSCKAYIDVFMGPAIEPPTPEDMHGARVSTMLQKSVNSFCT